MHGIKLKKKYIRVIYLVFYSINCTFCALRIADLGYKIEDLFPVVRFFNIGSRPGLQPA
jgi:hypothetical protein